MNLKLVIAEKPSVAQSYAKILDANKREDGYLEGNGYIVSWCVGHLVELAEPEAYDEKYAKWRYEDLPIIPRKWKYDISPGTKKQFLVLKGLMNRNDVTTVTCATECGSEGYTRLITRTKEADSLIRCMSEEGKISIKESSPDDIFTSQKSEIAHKKKDFWIRKNSSSLFPSSILKSPSSH